MGVEKLPYGLYEQVLTNRLKEILSDSESGAPFLQTLDPEEAHILLSQYVAATVAGALRSLPRSSRLADQVALVNSIVETVRRAAPKAVDAGDHILDEVLQAFLPMAPDPGQSHQPPERPGIPLSQSDLLINARGEHRIGHELQREIESADRIDLICSFIKWGGVRLLLPVLTNFLTAGKQMRVLTTTYLGSTDLKAIEKLNELGADIRISYDTRRTRLHAKAWLLHRESGFSTAYIGSSNLSATAQTDGLEWNVRVSSVDASRIIRKFEAAFDNYWFDGEFVPFDGSEAHKVTFNRAISKERAPQDSDDPIAFFDIRPYPFQSEILDRLRAEREVHGRSRNLVVAATGTGKTVIAALDFKRLLASGQVESLLFIAHRREILRQSRLMFRHVLRDGSFGEMWVDGQRPSDGQHVFASVQSLARVDLSELDPTKYDMVVVDEFHHAAARTYERLLAHLSPKLLLGLTATPERADGRPIMGWFDNHVAGEIRIWDAIERSLLVPFQYFGVHDNTDLRNVAWKKGRYATAELEALYTGNHLRANMVLQTISRQVTDFRSMRALGFCVSIKHAEFMAQAFSQAGIPAMAMTSETLREERESGVAKLRRLEVNVIFSVDLFNEGIDIPEVDTVLFLRPTESATVFLQQLGRGLRMCEGKDCLTVLDFVGNAKKEFRFDVRFGALLGLSRSGVRKQVELGFPLLPSGCSIQLDRQSREIVLENLRRAVGSNKRSMVAELRRLGPSTSLAEFLGETGLSLGEVYRGGRFFSDLKRAAGFDVSATGPEEDRIGRALSRILHMDEPGWIAACIQFLETGVWDAGKEKQRDMFLVSLVGPDLYGDPLDAIARLRQHPAICQEISEILKILGQSVEHVPVDFLALPGIPLKMHCRYSRDQIMAAFAITKGGQLFQPREGVVFDDISGANLLFVTVTKSERDYSPSTMYEDYAVSADEFHWQSQATTRSSGLKGRRHWQHDQLGVTPLLFVRESRKNEHGATAAYFFLGPAGHLSHHGERPMTVTWRLEQPIPGDWLRRLRVA